MSQVEVLSVTNTGRRRRWKDAEKLRIVQENYAGVFAQGKLHGSFF